VQAEFEQAGNLVAGLFSSGAGGIRVSGSWRTRQKISSAYCDALRSIP
jgi:hypothetical protein